MGAIKREGGGRKEEDYGEREEKNCLTENLPFKMALV